MGCAYGARVANSIIPFHGARSRPRRLIPCRRQRDGMRPNPMDACPTRLSVRTQTIYARMQTVSEKYDAGASNPDRQMLISVSVVRSNDLWSRSAGTAQTALLTLFSSEAHKDIWKVASAHRLVHHAVVLHSHPSGFRLAATGFSEEAACHDWVE